jgi:hypothetical protein
MTTGNGELAAFASGIRFRWIQPEQAMVPFHLMLRHQLGRLRCPLDLVIARLPERGIRMRRLLRTLCTIPRMSTFAIAAVINRAVSLMPEGSAFVNVGVWNGFTYLAGMAGNAPRRCVGVDNFSEFGGPKEAFLARFERRKSPRHDFYEMDYAEYFAKRHDGPIGVYLYDGEHGYENQRRGLETAERFFAPGCVIVVDDTNLPEPRRATLDFMAAHPDRYRLLLDRTTCANGHPTFWNGLLVFQRAA